MRYISRAIGIVLFLSSYSLCYAWNAIGHRLVAQIAWDNMTPQAKRKFGAYNHALNKVERPLSWQQASVWLDKITYTLPTYTSYSVKQNQLIASFTYFIDHKLKATDVLKKLGALHYISLLYVTDGLSPDSFSDKINALWAILRAAALLTDSAVSAVDKAVSLRILIHVIADIHQPLHAIEHVSLAFPQGDRGGNAVFLYHNRIAKNLHAYWDRGGGRLMKKHRVRDSGIKKMAKQFEHRFPCQDMDLRFNPKQWANESKNYAIKTVYINADNIDESYQRNAQHLTEQRITQAGCRLAYFLNALS